MAPTSEDTRDRVLAAVRSADTPRTVEELAADLGVHPNTVRFHTAALEDEGLLAQDRRPTGGKGRPRTVWAATVEGQRSGRRNYELLSSVLLDHLIATADDPVAAARAAGRAWGSGPAGETTTDRDPEQALVEFLDEMNFEPAPDAAGQPTEIRLKNCPFRELVDTHAALVCSLHAGLLEGMGAGQGANPRRVELIPFATPASCLVRIHPEET